MCDSSDEPLRHRLEGFHQDCLLLGISFRWDPEGNVGGSQQPQPTMLIHRVVLHRFVQGMEDLDLPCVDPEDMRRNYRSFGLLRISARFI